MWVSAVADGPHEGRRGDSWHGWRKTGDPRATGYCVQAMGHSAAVAVGHRKFRVCPIMTLLRGCCTRCACMALVRGSANAAKLSLCAVTGETASARGRTLPTQSCVDRPILS